mmetsp:Transcript_8764/g.10033  ORF Transcript_8764/g.10033 Transcript_8764/m.10033 type:complete len:551 (-) Transcript_8764:204-1856(-)
MIRYNNNKNDGVGVVEYENNDSTSSLSRRIRRKRRTVSASTTTFTSTIATIAVISVLSTLLLIRHDFVDVVEAFNKPAPFSITNQQNNFYTRLHASTTTTRLSKDVSLSSAPSSSPTPDEESSGSSSTASSSSKSSVSTGYDRQEFEMQVGRAMDTLRNDYPDFLHCKDPDYSIYSMDLELIDPSGVHLHGVKNYKNAIQIVHTLVGIFYCPQLSTVQFRMVYDKARQNIRISWNAEVIPKSLFGGIKRVLHVDGISIYELDRMSGNITQHRLERLVMNDDIVQEEQGIFAALRNHAIQSQRDHGRVGVPALSGMDDMIHPILTSMEDHVAAARHVHANSRSSSNNNIPNQILRFKNNNNKRSLLFEDEGSDTTTASSSSRLQSHNMGDANSMAMMNMNNDPESALKKKNLLRRKFGLKPIDMKEFVELEANIAELDYQQQQKKKEADAMAAIEMEQRMKKQRQKEIAKNSGINGIFQKLFGDALEDTCESNYDCQRPEVCCDMGFKKMCCSSGMRVFNAPHNGEGVLVPVTISPTPDPTLPPTDPRNNF